MYNLIKPQSKIQLANSQYRSLRKPINSATFPGKIFQPKNTIVLSPPTHVPFFSTSTHIEKLKTFSLSICGKPHCSRHREKKRHRALEGKPRNSAAQRTRLLSRLGSCERAVWQIAARLHARDDFPMLARGTPKLFNPFSNSEFDSVYIHTRTGGQYDTSICEYIRSRDRRSILMFGSRHDYVVYTEIKRN